MGEFFHGWRRKIGVVTLLMACLCAVLWIRSLNDGDVAWMKIRGEYFTLRSGNGNLQLNDESKLLTIVSASKHNNPLFPQGAFQPVFDLLIPRKEVLKFPPTARMLLAGLRREVIIDRATRMEKAPWWQTYRAFDKDCILGNNRFFFKDKKGMLGHTSSAVKTGLPEPYFSIPYWSIVMPLTLLSAWLLLSKPRPSTRKRSAEPIPDEVA